MIIRTPSSIKIDKYLETYRLLHYVYDFGDEWEINIALEKIVDDYCFGYPTVLDGAGDAPPEDLGQVPKIGKIVEKRVIKREEKRRSKIYVSFTKE